MIKKPEKCEHDSRMRWHDGALLRCAMCMGYVCPKCLTRWALVERGTDSQGRPLSVYSPDCDCGKPGRVVRLSPARAKGDSDV